MNDYDRRRVALYDEDNPDGPDHDFYRVLADEVSAYSIVDLGCGTGILTVTFARQGRTVVGVDPSASMLAYARRRIGTAGVNWIVGDSRSIPAGLFDYAVMTGNVAQHMSDPDWNRTLSDLRKSLRKGGTLSFESRNPAVRAWESWASDERTTRETVTEAQVLVFRDRSALEGQLNAAGFDGEAVYGDWKRSSLLEEAPVMVFVARAR